MKAILKRIITSVGVFALLLAPSAALVPASVQAQDISSAVCDGALLEEDADCTTEDSQDNFNTLAIRIINIFSVVVGAVSVIMIIVGGFRYIISGGDSNGVSGAKNTILYAIVGLVIVLFAQVIVRFVLSNTQTPS